MEHSFYRLSIDVDLAGNPLGMSYDVHSGDRVVAIHVLSRPGPFDSVQEAFAELLESVHARYGVQLPLMELE